MNLSEDTIARRPFSIFVQKKGLARSGEHINIHILFTFG